MVTAAGDAHGHSGGGRSGANYRVRWTRLDEGYLKGRRKDQKVTENGGGGHRSGAPRRRSDRDEDAGGGEGEGDVREDVELTPKLVAWPATAEK